jgi:hypothetical protein
MVVLKRRGRLFSGWKDAGSARGLLRLGSMSVGAVRPFSKPLMTLLIVFQLLGIPTGLDGRLEEER